VAASKVQKNKTKMEAIAPMFLEAKEFLARGIYCNDVENDIFFAESSGKRTAYVVVCGERGLCGSYNANVLKKAMEIMDGKDGEHIITVGAKCKEFFARRKKHMIADYAGVLENVSYLVAEDIAQHLMDLYLSADLEVRVDELYIVYTQFETLLSQEPCAVKLLPFDSSALSAPKEIIYEPDVNIYLKKSVPVYLTMFIYGAMVESAVCEQASRMTSMDAASRNAGEIVDKLTLQYNRIRQGAITQEISEIVGGANAI